MLKKLIFIFLLTIFTPGTASAAGDGVSVNASVDKSKITIGDPVSYTVTLDHPEGFKPLLPETPPVMTPWEILDVKAQPPSGGKPSTGLIYTLTAFTTGEISIPELSFDLLDTQGSTVTVTTRKLIVTIDSVLGLAKDKPGLRDIKPPLALRIPASVYFTWLLIIGLVAAGAWFWYYNYRKRLSLLPPAPAAPPVPPYQLAAEELEKLKNSELVKEGKIKEFYITLSDIIRRYLGAIYTIDTADKTTGEIYQELRRHENDKKALITMKEFFEECDLVKFAKYKPDEKTLWTDFESAKNIIEL